MGKDQLDEPLNLHFVWMLPQSLSQQQQQQMTHQIWDEKAEDNATPWRRCSS